ncbi:MAG: S-layer homology domain-containing protein, partial [Clostridia bacterium]|nr:S-layer homology domain-containing protein [Clostridia bacterium]
MIKKLFILSLCFALVISPMRLFAASADDTSYISVSYSPETRKLIVDGCDSISVGSAVVVHLVLGSNASPSEDNPPVVFDMVFAAEGGRFHSETVLPSDSANGIYTVCVGNDARDAAYTKDIIIFNGNSNATKEALKAVNSASNSDALEAVLWENGADLGIDMQTFTSPSVFSKVIYAVMVDEGEFTLGQFSDAASFAKGAVILINGGNVTDVMRNYASAFEYTNEQYEALDSKVRAKADGILLGSNFYDGYVSYNDAVLTAKVNLAESYGELKNLITSQSDEYKADIGGDYDRLSNNDKSTVFKTLFKDKDSFKTIDDIAAAFESAVDMVMSPPSAGGGGGGGAGGSGSDSRGHSGASSVVGNPSPSVAPVSPFSDIESTFAKENIIRLSSLGIINGYENGTFRPENTVTRAEFCKMVCVAFDFGGTNIKSFADVSENDWFYSYVGV